MRNSSLEEECDSFSNHDGTRRNRHWIGTQILFDRFGHFGSFGMPFWGNQFTVNSGQPETIGLVVMRRGNLDTGVINVLRPSRVLIHRIQCEFYDGSFLSGKFTTVAWPNFTPSGQVNTTLPRSNLLTSVAPLTNAPFTDAVSSALLTEVASVGALAPVGLPAINGTITPAALATSVPSTLTFAPVPGTTSVALGNLESHIFNFLLYVGEYTAQTAATAVRDPLGSSGDIQRDYLDLVTEASGFYFAGPRPKKWVLRLPQPIELGVGQRLLATVTYKCSLGCPLQLFPFIRSEITILS
jgi:hypothetical protein